jgi:low temperature requirement protein LtrA
VAVDLVVLTAMPAEVLRRGIDRQRRQALRRHPERPLPEVVAAELDRAHLAERLGLFVIIVLGEGVVQVVHTASGLEWHGPVLGASLAGFLLLVGMFGLSLTYGYAGVPHLRAGALGMRAALVLHGLVTGTIATVAVSLANVVAHGRTPLDDADRWLLCGGVAAYFALGLVASIAAHGVRTERLLLGAVTGVGVPLLLGLVATDISGIATVWYVVLVVVGHLAVERRGGRPGHAG